MIQELSAGLILFWPGPPRLYLLLDHGAHWDFPKGHVEPGEGVQAAALRELAEEAGITGVALVPTFTASIHYTYRRGGHPVTKRVHFFLAESPTRQVFLSHEHRDYAWLPYHQALRRLTYGSARGLLAEAEAALPHDPEP